MLCRAGRAAPGVQLMMASSLLLGTLLLALCGEGARAAGWVERFSENVNFTLFLPHRNVTHDAKGVTELIRDPSFDKNRVTVIYFHGYTESNNSESVGLISRAFLKRGDHNFILVDWNEYSKAPYLRAFFNLFQVSHAIAGSISALVRAGLPQSKLWIVAHSLGGQLAGVVCKDLDFKVPRITALDPALPGFTLDGVPSLGRVDAELVDVIHTDSGFLGISGANGHLNFWPNGGSRVQPGCPAYSTQLYDGHCSHHKSWRYFAESLLNETAFPALPCTSWQDFQDGKCEAGSNSVAYMGIKAGEARGRKGNLYLYTNAESPFGRGLNGLKKEASGPLKAIGNVLKRIPSFGGDPLVTDFGWAS